MSMDDLFPPLINRPNPMQEPKAPAVGQRGHVEPYEAENDPEFSYDGFQVTRREYYAHNNEPAISFSDGRLGINAVCLKKPRTSVCADPCQPGKEAAGYPPVY